MTSVTVSSTSRRRLTGFRVAALLTGLVMLLAGLQAVVAPWSLPGDTGDAHAEAHQWFITVAGATDISGAIGILALAIRPALKLLAVNTLVGVAVAALVNMPVDPMFGVLVLVLTPMLVLYPYWPAARDVRTWWTRPIKPLLWPALATTTAVATVAAVCYVRQFAAHDTAAAVNWWADYAEHLILLGVVLLFAATGLPGWRVLAATASAAWIYLGLIAIFVVPDQTASWRTPYALLGILLGAHSGLTVVLRRNDARRRTGPQRRTRVGQA
jgi:hypothetical protein